MASTVRSFIGSPVRCSPGLERVLDALDRMGRAVRPVKRDQMHLTIKFLGEIPWTQTAEISRMLAQELASFPPVEARLKGLGAFPRAERPNVVWVGMEPAEPLGRLAGLLSDALAEQGFPPEQRSFAAHVTLARIKARPPAELRELLAASSEEEFGPAPVDRVVLYQSELTSTGPMYTVLSEHALAYLPEE